MGAADVGMGAAVADVGMGAVTADAGMKAVTADVGMGAAVGTLLCFALATALLRMPDIVGGGAASSFSTV